MPASTRRTFERLHPDRLGSRGVAMLPQLRRHGRWTVEQVAVLAAVTRGDGPHRYPIEAQLAVRIRRRTVHRLAGDGEQHPRRLRSFEDHQWRPGVVGDELDVVGDDEALERGAHGLRARRRHVEPHLVGQHIDTQVRHDLALLRQQRGIRPFAGLQLGDIVGHHALQEADAIGAGQAQQPTEARIEQAAALAHGRPLALQVAEAGRQVGIANGDEPCARGTLDGFQLRAHWRSYEPM